MRSRLLITALLAAIAVTASAQTDSPVLKSRDEYSQICRELKAVTGRSVQEIRGSMGDLVGQYVEIRGKVLGRAHPASAGAGNVSVLLRCDEDSCFISCPPEMADLRPGKRIRALVKLPTDATGLSDGELAAVTEDAMPVGPSDAEEIRPSSEPVVGIGEAARGVRDRVPWLDGQGSPVPPSVPLDGDRGAGLPSAGPATQPRVGEATGGQSALPPELRGRPTLSNPNGVTKTNAAAPVVGAPPGMPIIGVNYTPDQVARIYAGWIRGINSARTDIEALRIAQWTLYHCMNNGVDHRLMFAVMKYESDFNPRCKSHAGAMGLTQLMPVNCKDFKVADPYDIRDVER